MNSVVAVALSALVTSWWSGQDILTLNLSRAEDCERLRTGMPEGTQDIYWEKTDFGCALHLPGASAWNSRPTDFGAMFRLAGLSHAQQVDLELLMERIVRQGRVPVAHLYPTSTPALVRVEEAVDDFNRGLASRAACRCSQATLEQSRVWVGWTIRPTGNCGEGLLAGDAPAWCPESGRFVPMSMGVGAVLLVTLGLVVRRALRRRQPSASPTTAGGSASP